MVLKENGATLDYSKIPYDPAKAYKHVRRRGGFFNPDPELKENREIYRGYYTDDFFGLEIDVVKKYSEEMTKLLDW